MDLLTTGPIRAAELRWRLPSGAPALTIVCKATFALRPGESPLAAQQDEPNEEDTYWNDDPERSLSAASDLVPFKARAEVVLVGHAFAPEPARVLAARLCVGAVDKTIQVHADRAVGPDGVLREGPLFTKMRLGYERAAGGPGTANPVGVRPDARDARGHAPLPNLEPAGARFTRLSDPPPPVGFGPIAPTWPERRARAPRGFPSPAWRDAPLPEAVDRAYFNVAPADQRLDALHPREPIALEHLHPQHALLTTSLPGVVPRVFLERSGRAPEPLLLMCDTLAIDTDRAVCHLVWRGTSALAHPAEVARVVVSVETLSGAGAEPPAPRAPSSLRTMSQPLRTPKGTLPFAATRDDPDRAPPSMPAPDTALPFSRDGQPRPPPAAPAALPVATSEEGTDVFDLPPAPAAPASVQAPSAPPSVPARAAPSRPEASWSAAALEDTPPRGYFDLRRPDEPAPALSSRTGEPERLGSFASAPEPAVAPRIANAALGGAVAASHAAADPQPTLGRSAARRGVLKTKGAVDLVWLDAESVSRIRRKPAWRALLSEVESRAPFDPDEASLGNTPEEMEDRRDVLHVLVRGDALDEEGLTDAGEGAVRADGRVIPPLVVTSGTISFAFDELETLKATLSSALAFSPGDEALGSATALAKELLATPGLLASAEVASALTARVREAFEKTKRAVPADYLKTQAERALLEKRQYQKREVFSRTHVLGLFVPEGATAAIPTYLPDDVAKKLPLYQTFAVRMIVEVHPTTDQHEAHPMALRALALGRGLPARG